MKLSQLSLALGLLVYRGAARVILGDGTSDGEVFVNPPLNLKTLNTIIRLKKEAKLLNRKHWERSTEELSLLTVGQGYNTFLGKGRTYNAVKLRGSKTQRDLSKALDNDLMFKFTEPKANLTNLNIMEYFAPIDLDLAIDRALAEQDEAEEDEARQEVPARFKRDEGSNCLAETRINTIETSDFNSYLKAIGIDASAAVSGYGQEASVSGSYLDNAEMMRSTLTYLTVITVDQQVHLTGDYIFNSNDYSNETFAQSYGNRWIRGFSEGGKMIIRLSFTSTTSITKEELNASVKVALSYLGASGSLSASVKKSIDEVQKNSNMEVSVFYQGAVGKAINGGSGEKIEETSAPGALQQVKSKVNAFLAVACDHKYKYKPLLDRYEHLANFPLKQKVISYHYSERIARIVLEQLIKCSEMRMTLKRMKHIDSNIKRDIEFNYADITHNAREWTKATARDPTNPKQKAIQLLNSLDEKFIKKYRPLLEPQDYISGITVKYGRKWPEENVHEVNGRGDDLNKGFGGEDSFFVASTTRDPERACASFDFVINLFDAALAYPDTHSGDISKGTGDIWYRNIACVGRGVQDLDKIRKVALLRSESGFEDYISKEENGFLGGNSTTNINQFRGTRADTLYLLWAY